MSPETKLALLRYPRVLASDTVRVIDQRDANSSKEEYMIWKVMGLNLGVGKKIK